MKDRYDLRCLDCGQFIGFQDPDAHCKEVRSMDILGNVDEREECFCGRCVRKAKAPVSSEAPEALDSKNV